MALRKLCESCAAKMAIIMVSLASPYVEQYINGCSDPNCRNFCESSNGAGSSQYSVLNELPEAQLVILAHLHLNHRDETEKLKQLLAIPPERMNDDQRSSASEEIDKLINEVSKLMEDKQETSPISNNNNKNNSD
ncbi:hypothetical protein K1719_014290 [Acacia pycnantha]|nr:hypothetical protein K1719_014290 [Acacia pycnantha]